MDMMFVLKIPWISSNVILLRLLIFCYGVPFLKNIKIMNYRHM